MRLPSFSNTQKRPELYKLFDKNNKPYAGFPSIPEMQRVTQALKQSGHQTETPTEPLFCTTPQGTFVALSKTAADFLTGAMHQTNLGRIQNA
ncbi:MAG: hypothetical protein VKJ06_02300 [Vampirovibrionales bacterium]|nr:hypothetical protein [Vampirovibrionales bacterium]